MTEYGVTIFFWVVLFLFGLPVPINPIFVLSPVLAGFLAAGSLFVGIRILKLGRRKMKISINGDSYQVRVQDRKVIFADIMTHGETVASGVAILNPVDRGNEEKGLNIAVGRALKELREDSLADGRDFDHTPIQKSIVKRVQKRPGLLVSFEDYTEGWSEGFETAKRIYEKTPSEAVVTSESEKGTEGAERDGERAIEANTLISRMFKTWRG